MVIKIKALMLGMMQEVGCGQDVQFKESKNSFVGPDFLNFLYRGQSSLSGRLSMRQDSGSDKAATCETELEMYIASSWIGTNPLEFWKSAEAACLPRLKILAKQVLCAPATTADVKRMFSVAGNLLSNRKLKTSDEHFERLLFCSINKRRLDGDLNVGGKRKLNS
ncbi:uncharacterized protein LOC129591373 [Paramacrobiotus metropolitanus]|uniref:uncharacterized protein LOC129591373 n=1 Tax=Paramacrobiotus metropolitanus TaxID=2943436 RepID=UPI0024459C9F|nr:uncharacterized protein LOC129591373 [Paramacrobiotus metropolitanus]